MPATRSPHEPRQSLWLDHITRDLLEKGTLERYIEEPSVTGLTSDPTIFDHATTRYDGHFHDLLNDIDKEIVMADIKNWIVGHLRGSKSPP